MDAFDLVGALRSYADFQEWHFLYGDSFTQNYEASQEDYNPCDYILMADPFDGSPTFSGLGNTVLTIVYSGVLALGRKRESITESNLDETHIQKFDNRLKELNQLLLSTLTAFACENALTIQAATFSDRLNVLDENIDFVSVSVTLLQDL